MRSTENSLSSRAEKDVISNIVNTVLHYREIQTCNEPLKLLVWLLSDPMHVIDFGCWTCDINIPESACHHMQYGIALLGGLLDTNNGPMVKLGTVPDVVCCDTQYVVR